MNDSRPADVSLRSVRAAEHAETIAQIHATSAGQAYRHIFHTPFPDGAARQRWARHEGQVLVAYHGDRPVGFVAVDGDTVEALYVLPHAWSQGVGTTLLATAPTARRLWVLEGNAAGRRFYERRGWHWSRKARPAPDADGVSELLYVRELDQRHRP